MARFAAAMSIFGVFLAVGCSQAREPSDPAAARGREVYLRICTACHNADPTRDGSLGPAVAGASRELLEAKLLRGEYPEGYVPKRPTAVMPVFPDLADSVDDLAVFLAAATEPAPEVP